MTIIHMLIGLMAATLVQPASAGEPAPRPGWVVMPTALSFEALNKRLDQAVGAHGMNIVNSASASVRAAAEGFTIPGNRVVGVFRNDFARRMLAASVAAGIEAPIRFYVTENAEHTATLSWRTPTAVFAPYVDEGGAALTTLATELDAIFTAIATDVVKP